MTKIKYISALAIVLGLSVFYYFSPTLKEARFVDGLVDRNISARGGAEAWSDISSLRFTGEMDVGQGVHLPYVLDQKRPGMMCLEFVFDGDTAVQCSDGDSGWKIVPFRGRSTPEPMSGDELREASDSVDLYGLLYNYAERGNKIKYLGSEQVAGREVFKLKITTPRGAVRWLYLDAESALEVKLETQRIVSGKERRVETYFHDWVETDGLLISRRQVTRTEGDNESHFITVKNVDVNPDIDDARFTMPLL